MTERVLDENNSKSIYFHGIVINSKKFRKKFHKKPNLLRVILINTALIVITILIISILIIL